jgi:cytochrome P450
VVAELAAELVDRWPGAGEVDATAAGSRLAVDATMRTLFAGADADGHGLADDIDALVHDDRLFPAGRRAYPPDAPERFARVSSGFAGVMAGAAPGQPGVPPRLRAVAEARGVDAGTAAMTAAGVFAAGVETTVHALAYALGLLAERPDVQAWLAEEVDDALAGRGARGDDAARLPRCRAAFAETLRLYPPSWFIARWTRDDVELAGEAVAAGTTVLVCPYLLHRDGRFFADPDAYRPSRWMDGAPPRLAYIPFGAGRRQCLGERIAWAEGTLLLAAATRFTLSPAGPLPAPMAGAALRPERPVVVRVRARGA